MGIVFKQSLNNTLITYLGFAIGAVNTLFLYTEFLTAEYYGLVGVILATATILMPILAFGIPNTLVKFYSSFSKDENSDSFLTLMLLLPFLVILPLLAFAYFANDLIGDFLAKENAIVKGYVWHIFVIGLAMAYFEIFYAWARVQMKSVFGNFMKEVFVRVGVMVLLILVFKETISVNFFLKALVSLYVIRMIFMKLYAYKLRMPKLNFKRLDSIKSILNYTILIIFGGSAAVVLLEVDKVMLNQLIDIKNVAYYGVAVYIAVVIGVPARSMQQITSPLTAKLLNEKDSQGLKTLYQKTSLTLFIASGILFLLIVLNVEELYVVIPEAYRGGFFVVLMIGLVKVYDSLLGNNNAILYNSDYYRAVLLMAAFLVVLTIVFNLWLIPEFGIEGAAMASLLSFFIFNTLKLVFVKIKFGMLPFTSDTLKVLALLIVVGVPFYFLEFPYHPIDNILLKSIPMILIYMFVLYRFKISEDIVGVIDRFLKRLR